MTINSAGPLMRKLYSLAENLRVRRGRRMEKTADSLERLLRDFGLNIVCELHREIRNLKTSVNSLKMENERIAREKRQLEDRIRDLESAAA